MCPGRSDARPRPGSRRPRRDAQVHVDGGDRGHPLADRRRIGEDQADLAAIGLGRAARGVVDLEQQPRAGRDELGQSLGQHARRHPRRIGRQEVDLDRIRSRAGRAAARTRPGDGRPTDSPAAPARPAPRRPARAWGRPRSSDRASSPSAGILTVLGRAMTRSGVGMRQPSTYLAGSGRSRVALGRAGGDPGGDRRFFSSSLSRASLANLPYSGLACQGGMRPSCTTSSIISAQPAACLYVASANGAISPSRWQATQRSRRIRATCFE